MELHIEQTMHEVTVEALLTSGQRVLILDAEDLEQLVGEKYTKEIREKIYDICLREKGNGNKAQR